MIDDTDLAEAPDTMETADALGGLANLPPLEHDPTTQTEDLATTHPTEQPPPIGGSGQPPAPGAG